MKVSKDWLKELIDLKVLDEELVRLLPLRTIGTKEITEDFIELDMKGYNRSDLLSMRGVALEVAAITDSKVNFEEPKVHQFSWIDKNFAKLEVSVKNEALAPVYCLVKIEGLKVGKSNPEWVKKLEDSGYRAINNVADVTNLVMLEYGQPLHAFDASQVEEETIIVRTATEGEEIETLDGKKRKLQKTDLLITDPKKAVGIAGVMGGKNSEISDRTTSILLEAAIFEPRNLRETSMRLGLISEAGKRFYHGLTKTRLLQAFDAAIKMYESLGGKVTGIFMQGEFEDQLQKIPVTRQKVNSLIGVDLSEEDIERFLGALNFDLMKVDEGSWVVTPPYYRLDVLIEEDVIEEVARMYGYERIEAKELPGEKPEKIDQSQFELLGKIKNELVDQGLMEVQTYSFYSTQVLENLGWNEGENLKHLIKIANPISKETEYLRMTVWPNLVEVAAKNIKNGIKDIAIFEVGKMFSLDTENNPNEEYELAVVVSGPDGNSLAKIYEIYKKVAEILGLPEKLEPSSPPSVVAHLFHPNKFLPIKKDGEQIGGLAELHPRIVNKFGVEQKIAVLGINLSKS